MPYNVIFNGFQGPSEEIPPTDPLVAVPAGISAFTPYGIHVTMAGAQVSLPQLCSAINRFTALRPGTYCVRKEKRRCRLRMR